MICFECGNKISDDFRSNGTFGVFLCETHQNIIDVVLEKLGGHPNIGRFYFTLKKLGLYPFIGWWNGERHVPIAFGRYRLNLEFYDTNLPHDHSLALKRQQIESYDHQRQFICLHIPLALLEDHLTHTALLIHNIHEGLRAY